MRDIKQSLSFAWYCFKRGNDNRFVDEVRRIGKRPLLVTLEKPEGERSADGEFPAKGERTADGALPAEGAIYHIAMERSDSGFFADYNRLLQYLYFADRMRLRPVVEYSQAFCYAEDHPVNGTTNPFEYYFRQPAGISLQEMGKLGTVVRSRKENTVLAMEAEENRSGYARSEGFIREMARIAGRYIRCNEIVGKKLSEDVHGLLPQGGILGVHVRGTDYKRAYHGHPVMVTTEDTLQAVKQIESKYQRIFLATDDLSTVRQFEETFPGRVSCYNDVIRSDGDETVMKAISDRKDHHYLLGYEVLRDMFTLASCDGLVAGLSQVSLAARIHRRVDGGAYRDEVILDKGIIRKGAGGICR